MNAGDTVFLGYVHLIDIDPSEGLVWNIVTNGKMKEIISLRDEEISSLTIPNLFKVTLC